MFGRKQAPRNEASTRIPFWKMNAAQRLTASAERVLKLRDFFVSKGAEVSFESSTLIVKTQANNYFVDVADDEPRAIIMQVIYEVLSGDLATASWACYNASALSRMAKAKAIPEKDGYRLHFSAEVWADDLSAFTDVASLYMAAIEDLRCCYMAMMTQGIDEIDSSWSTRPLPPPSKK